jgi:hypothetical protein
MKLTLSAGSRRADRDQWTAALAAAPTSRARHGTARSRRLARLTKAMAADGRVRAPTDHLCRIVADDFRPVSRRVLDHTLLWGRRHGWLAYGPSGGPGHSGRDYIATIPAADGGAT